MSNHEMKAKISKKLSKNAVIMLIAYELVALTIIILGFALYSYHGAGDSWSEWFGIELSYTFFGALLVNGGNIVLVTFIILLIVLLPLIYFLIGTRKRKLSELSVSDSEVVGSYTALIPVAKITLRMPIEKIDNVSAVNSFFFLFTGKAIRIGSASNVIKIPYVLNADEVVAFIAEAIESARKGQAKPVA